MLCCIVCFQMQVADEEAMQAELEYAEWEATAKPMRGVSATQKAKKRAQKQQDLADQAAAEAARDQAAAAAAAAAGGEGEEFGQLPLGYYQPVEEPMQVKMEWVLINKGGWCGAELQISQLYLDAYVGRALCSF
jgi:hypothetical protein